MARRATDWDRNNYAPEELEGDPKDLYNIVDAQGIINEELAKDVTDYDRIAEARIRLEELSKVKSRTVKIKDIEQRNAQKVSPLVWIVMLSGLTLVLSQIFLTDTHASLLVIGAGMMGLPSFLQYPGASTSEY